jgi:beta-galactosidase
MGLFPFVDAAALSADLDFVSWDNYPRLPAPWSPFNGDWRPQRLAMSHDLMRGVKGRTFWVMEQQAGPSGWGQLSPTPLPGEIRLWTLQSVARGAAGIVYFRWRTCRFGTEQYWHGILPHDGGPGRRYEEVRRTGEDLRRLGALLCAPLPTEVGVIRSYETLWAFEAQPGAQGLSYDDQIARYYNALWRRQVPADLITEDRPWDAYRLLIAPCLFVLRDDVAARLRAWVEAGGTLVLSFRSGVKDVANMAFDAPPPGPLAELAGVRVADYTALLPEGGGAPTAGPGKLTLGVDGTQYALRAEVWMDDLEPQGAEVLGRYRGEPYDGAPAITLHRVGAGRVIYVGTALDDAGHDLLLRVLLAEAGVAAGPRAPDQIEMVRRVHEGVDHWFILNHGDRPRDVALPAAGTDLLSGRHVQGTVSLSGRDALVLRADGA